MRKVFHGVGKPSKCKKIRTWKGLIRRESRLYAPLNCFRFWGVASGRKQIGLDIPKTKEERGRITVTEQTSSPGCHKRGAQPRVEGWGVIEYPLLNSL